MNRPILSSFEIASAEPTASHTLRLMSANLWNGRAHPEPFAALVESLSPDVVAVQELTHAAAAALQRVMPHGLLEPAENFRGMGIALRRPSEVTRIALPYRDARVTVVQPHGLAGDGATIEVINVHVRAPHLIFPPATWQRRRYQLRGLQRYMDQTPRPRRIVMGDFNATPGWPVYERMAARMTDAAVAVAKRNGHSPRPTWGPWPTARRLLRLDHAFVTGVHVADFRVIPVPGGDHCAILVDVVVQDFALSGNGRRS